MRRPVGRFVVAVMVVVLSACGGSSGTSKACDKLHKHRTAVREQMRATSDNDVARYNALVELSNKDYDAMKAKDCPIEDFAP